MLSSRSASSITEDHETACGLGFRATKVACTRNCGHEPPPGKSSVSCQGFHLRSVLSLRIGLPAFRALVPRFAPSPTDHTGDDSRKWIVGESPQKAVGRFSPGRACVHEAPPPKWH